MQSTQPPKRKLSAKLARFYMGTTVVFWPFTDLVTRIFVALAFLRSGVVKASDWETAVALATYEYPVSWMDPVVAAATGLSIELVASVLLLIGFLTRPAALALAILTVVAQAVYIPTTTNLILIALLIWYVIHGAAAISVDFYWLRWLRKRSKLGERITALSLWTRKNLAPCIVLLIRLWLGAALLIYAGAYEPPIGLATWIPITSFSGLPAWVAILFAVLLITGTAASIVSYALTFVIGAFMLIGAHPDVTFYPVLLFGIYESRGAGFFSIDRFVEARLAKKFPSSDDNPAIDPDDWFGTLKSWYYSLRSSILRFRSQEGQG